MSKVLLRKALECEDSKLKSIANASLVYMAALHFGTSEYETTIELCSTLILNETTEEEEEETLNAGCLLYIDDIARIIGYYFLFRLIKYDFHYNERLHLLDLRITPEVFALYLSKLSHEKLSRYFRTFHDLRIQTFPLDEILMTITNWRSSGISKRADRVLRVYQITNPINKAEALNKSSLHKWRRRHSIANGVFLREYDIILQCHMQRSWHSLQHSRLLPCCISLQLS